MPRGKRTEDVTTLQMALVGYQIERQKIEDKIRDLQAQLKGTPSAAAKQAPATKRRLSPAARRRIAAAQKKRWARHRRSLAQSRKADKTGRAAKTAKNAPSAG